MAMSLCKLNPKLNGEGILQVGGRLENAVISYDTKHQITLPYRHHVTHLIIKSIIKKQVTLVKNTFCPVCVTCIGLSKCNQPCVKFFTNVTLHGKTGKKVMTRARYFNTLDKRKFL